MAKFLNLNIVQLELTSYKIDMVKKILLLMIILFAPITACSTLSEVNEKVKGDGVPYIPGI